MPDPLPPSKPHAPHGNRPTGDKAEGPQALDYRSTPATAPPAPPVTERLTYGCAYSFAVVFFTFLLLEGFARQASEGVTSLIFDIAATLLVVPFILALCFRGWRAFAMGMFILAAAIFLVMCAGFSLGR